MPRKNTDKDDKDRQQAQEEMEGGGKSSRVSKTSEKSNPLGGISKQSGRKSTFSMAGLFEALDPEGHAIQLKQQRVDKVARQLGENPELVGKRMRQSGTISRAGPSTNTGRRVVVEKKVGEDGYLHMKDIIVTGNDSDTIKTIRKTVSLAIQGYDPTNSMMEQEDIFKPYTEPREILERLYASIDNISPINIQPFLETLKTIPMPIKPNYKVQQYVIIISKSTNDELKRNLKEQLKKVISEAITFLQTEEQRFHHILNRKLQKENVDNDLADLMATFGIRGGKKSVAKKKETTETKPKGKKEPSTPKKKAAKK